MSEKLKSEPLSTGLRGSAARPRPMNTQWSNFDLSPPSTSVIGTTNTTPPIHFDQTKKVNDFNDAFGNF